MTALQTLPLFPGEKDPRPWREAIRHVCERLGLTEERRRMYATLQTPGWGPRPVRKHHLQVDELERAHLVRGLTHAFVMRFRFPKGGILKGVNYIIERKK